MVLLQRQPNIEQANMNVHYGEDFGGGNFEDEEGWGGDCYARYEKSNVARSSEDASHASMNATAKSPVLRKRRSLVNVTPRLTNIALFMTIVVLCYFQHANRYALITSSEEISRMAADVENVRDTIEDAEDELDAAHEHFYHLKTETLPSTAEDDHEYDDDEYYYYEIYTEDERKSIAADIIEKHDRQTADIHKLKITVQDFHRKELIRRFGEGPYHVEFKINNKGKTDYFTVETAPNELMPHSVFTFMDMVDRKVWDNSVFIHKWDHIVQAAPITPDGQNRRDEVDGVLSFPEYSEEFKHDQYTVGFSGRPGGPEFYINLTDNDASHGPGRQDHSTILHDADPCFAKIVRGKEAIDRLKHTSLEAINTGDEDGIAFSSIDSVKMIRPIRNEKAQALPS